MPLLVLALWGTSLAMGAHAREEPRPQRPRQPQQQPLRTPRRTLEVRKTRVTFAVTVP